MTPGPHDGRTDGRTERPFSKSNVQQWDKETKTFMLATRIPKKKKYMKEKHALIVWQSHKKQKARTHHTHNLRQQAQHI